MSLLINAIIINNINFENPKFEWLVVRIARPPDFWTFEIVNKPVTLKNNDKKTYGVQISGQISGWSIVAVAFSVPEPVPVHFSASAASAARFSLEYTGFRPKFVKTGWNFRFDLANNPVAKPVFPVFKPVPVAVSASIRFLATIDHPGTRGLFFEIFEKP
jgi:hypothetical protein